MKKIILSALILFIVCSATLRAQTEIKLSPLLIAGVVALSIEQGFGGEAGVELDVIGAEGGFYSYVSGKYYFNPRMGLDRFYAGVFVGGGSDVGAGGGFLIGTKLLSRSNKVLFEIGIGAGRSIINGEFIPAGKLHFGYRIGG
jgi:hypothetical protein